MESLVIVGRYPFPGRRLEGMVQRIANIDEQVSSRSRLYLDLYGMRKFRGVFSSIGNVRIYTASFLHFWSIFKILKSAKEVYIHSIYFYALVLLPLFFVNRRIRLILDIHGTVPEEMENAGNPLLAWCMGFVEKIAFSRVAIAVCVTRKMERFYLQKYPESQAQYIYLPIFTTEVCRPANPSRVRALRKALNIPIDAKVYLYSGGLQSWQNIDKTLDIAINLLESRNNWCIFLTGETEELSKKVIDRVGSIPECMVITYAKSKELNSYYEIADFGFILREDHILNRVANPTKLVEYLYFGMHPIVLSADIGDFIELGYEYVYMNELFKSVTPNEKSSVNRNIGLQLLQDVRNSRISQYL